MQLSFNGLNRIKDEEGFSSKAYKDTGGVWTIGYGTTRINGKPVQEGMVCTEAEALTYLAEDTAFAQTAVNQLTTVVLSQNMFDALVSFVYNIGVSAFQGSTMRRLLNAGDYKGAAAQFDRWNLDNGKVIKGLVARRRRERDLFETQ